MSSVLDHPWLAPLMRDAKLAALWDASAQLEHFRAFEAAYSRALGAADLVDPAMAERAALAIEAAPLDERALAEGCALDGLPIPAFVKQLKAAAGQDAEAVHTGATSQDVMDTALALTVKASAARLAAAAEAVRDRFAALADGAGGAEIMGRTRMQAALPIAVRSRIMVWSDGVEEGAVALKAAGARLSALQLGGPVGDGRKLGSKAHIVAAHMADALGLSAPQQAWHASRGRVVAFGGALSQLTGALGKIGQDVALMAQQGVDEIKLAGGGGSSAMPHKSNPIEAELLISLARYNASQLGGLHQALVHEQERSGAAWTLEWLILPEMVRATGGALMLAERLLGKIESIGRLD